MLWRDAYVKPAKLPQFWYTQKKFDQPMSFVSPDGDL